MQITEGPLVSIALCTYNGEKYLSDQLDSILNQTYRNLEIIIVDDRSADNTLNIIENYAQKDTRIKYSVNEINLNFNKNFERAITLTTGEYIAISDQDDIWLPRKIETLLNGIGNNWLIFSNSSYLSDDENTHGKMLNNFNVTGTYKGILLANFVTGHTTLMRREFVNYFLPFPEKGFYDWWMGFVALYHKKITFTGTVLTQYRIHQDSVMQNRLNSGEENKEEIKAISYMLSSFESYSQLKSADKTFISGLRNVYQLILAKGSLIWLIKMIVTNYGDLFPHHKNRKRFSLLNFAFKYARKVKKYA